METLTLHVLTWNVATRSPDEDLRVLLGLEDQATRQDLPDMYAIGLQEVKSQPQNIIMDALFEDSWTNSFRNILSQHSYVKVKTVRMQGLVLSLFCLKEHLIHLRDVEMQYTRTGLGGMWGNKGAVTLRMSLYGCSLCLVNCHLQPHDHLLQERIADYNHILAQQTFQAGETTRIFFHDYVFWFGDLNFRIQEGSLDSEGIERLLKEDQLTSLLEKDQLRHVMHSGEAFSELTETLPRFRPTYKFHFGTQNYDLKRRPGWPDRILYKVNPDVYENVTLKVTQKSYQSHPEYMTSDHKPVSADFTIKVFSCYYERVVEFLPIATWFVHEESHVTYRLSSDVEASSWDWIGLFKEDFSSLDDYLSYVYVPRGSDNSVLSSQQQQQQQALSPASINNSNSQFSVTFSEDAVRFPGAYVLLYFSQNTASVLGMSQPFRVCNRE